jgi:heme exporter protein B
MLMLGWVILLTLELQIDLPVALKQRVAGSLVWIGIFFAGTLSLDRSFTSERDGGCWSAMRMYPISPGVIYLSKLIFNCAALCCVAGVLIPAYVVISGAPLLESPRATVMIAVLASIGYAASGTLIGCLSSALSQRGNLLVLLLLPLVLPIVLAASGATELIIANDLGAEFWRWASLLVAYSTAFITIGLLLFEFVIEG